MKYTFEQLKAGYTNLWNGVKVTRQAPARAEAQKILNNKTRYKQLEAKTGVPWFCIGIIHTREAGSVDVGRFLCCLHNGQKIIGTGRKTTIVPIGKGPFATFEDAAIDALQGYKGTKWSVELLAYTLEKFNGFGYRNKGIPSPYLWGATNRQKSGKYVADGVYDANVMDTQVGGMAILKSMMELDPSINFNATVGVEHLGPLAPVVAATYLGLTAATWMAALKIFGIGVIVAVGIYFLLKWYKKRISTNV